MKTKLHYFKSDVEPQVGDTIATGRRGDCKLAEIVDGELRCINIMTGGEIWALADDCDLLDRPIAKMKTKHTSGPWRIESPDFAPDRAGYIEPNICEMSSSLAPDTVTANARLIAAAPELLAALQALIGLIDDKVQSEGSTLSGPTNYDAAYDERNATRWVCRARELVANAGAAISAATGEEKP